MILLSNNQKKKLKLPGILKKVYQNSSRVEDRLKRSTSSLSNKLSVSSSALSLSCRGIGKRLFAYNTLAHANMGIMDADVSVVANVHTVIHTDAESPLDENTVDSPVFSFKPPLILPLLYYVRLLLPHGVRASPQSRLVACTHLPRIHHCLPLPCPPFCHQHSTYCGARRSELTVVLLCRWLTMVKATKYNYRN